MSNGALKKTCFVVMGFGTKTDLATGRAIDLDKCYRLLIKPVVEKRGIICVRADEITHSGVIDVPMYQQLLSADLVVADISTANANAIYELGIRHALKPYTTIVISENKLKYPFDLNHILITSYSYLDGGGIDFEEVMRFQDVLGKMIDELMKEPKPDSPVYTYLNDLLPPSLKKKMAEAVAAAAAPKRGGARRGMAFGMTEASPLEAMVTPAAAPAVAEGPSLSELMKLGEQAIQAGDFASAKQYFGEALNLFRAKQKDGGLVRAEHPYLIQRLALATYETKQPSDAATVKALNEALKLLAPLKPAESNDPETLGLAGAIEKRLFDKNQKVDHLNRAIKYYYRGYCLRDAYYDGINLAYLLNVRADTSLDSTDAERTADVVVANRTRREVLTLCDRELKSTQERRKRTPDTSGSPEVDELREAQKDHDCKQHFWCLVTKAEAYFGLGDVENYKKTRAQALKLTPPPADWMIDSLDDQIGRLRPLLEKHGHLLDPPWTMP
jgi:tetratricopeptide (TPR) repeat protein